MAALLPADGADSSEGIHSVLGLVQCPGSPTRWLGGPELSDCHSFSVSERRDDDIAQPSYHREASRGLKQDWAAKAFSTVTGTKSLLLS